MIKFVREGRKLKVDPVSLTLEPLFKIWTYDKGTDKDQAVKHLAYIHLVSQIDPDAPYSKTDPTEVSLLVKKELFGDMNHKFEVPWDEEFMDNAVSHYQSAYESAEHSVVRSFNNKIHEMKRLMDTTPIEITKSVSRGSVTYVSNFTIMNKMMQDITKVVKSRDEMQASAIKESARGDLKGGRSRSFLEKRRKEVASARRIVSVSDDEISIDETEDEVKDL